MALDNDSDFFLVIIHMKLDNKAKPITSNNMPQFSHQ